MTRRGSAVAWSLACLIASPQRCCAVMMAQSTTPRAMKTKQGVRRYSEVPKSARGCYPDGPVMTARTRRTEHAGEETADIGAVPCRSDPGHSRRGGRAHADRPRRSPRMPVVAAMRTSTRIPKAMTSRHSVGAHVTRGSGTRPGAGHRASRHNVSDPAEHRRGEGFERRSEAHGVDDAELGPNTRKPAAPPRMPPADEGLGDDPVDVDAHEARRLGILGNQHQIPTSCSSPRRSGRGRSTW